MNIKNIKYISKHITEQEKYIIVFKCKNPPVLLMDLFYNKCLFTFLFKLLSSFVYRLDLLDYHLEQAKIVLLVLDMAFH